MNRRRAGTLVDTSTEISSVRLAGLQALDASSAGSLPAIINEILNLACRGLPAYRAAFWRLSSDAGTLRLLVATGSRGSTAPGEPARVAVTGTISTLLADDGAGCRARDADPGLATTLRFAPRTGSALIRPVRLLDVPLGLLCIEFLDDGKALDAETELFMQMLAARIERAYLAEPLVARQRRMDTGPHYPLQQSHLALDDGSLRDLFYLAPTAMMLSDPEQARPMAVNQHALALLGISTQSSGDLLTSDFWDDASERDRFVEKVRTEGHVRDWRTRLRRTDGKTFWAHVSASIIRYNGRQALISSLTDVSDTVAAEEILNRTQKTLMTLLEASPYPLIVTRLDNGVIRYCNRKAADMFETPLSGLLGHTAPEFYVKPSDRNDFIDRLRANGHVEGFIAKLKTQSGQPFWAMLSAKTLELNGEPVFMVAFADVTKQKNKEEELEHLAFRDGLTNAYNRRYFVEAARIELARAERNARPPVLTLIDIDHFKRLNDTLGHETGDRVLREFVRIVQGMLRKTDILSRYGGEEFAVLFPETEADVAFAIVERIRTTIAEHDFASENDAPALRITFSAGIALAGEDVEYAALVQAADTALYAAKRAGRNRTEAFAWGVRDT